MNKYLKQDERLSGEEVLEVIPFRPFSLLIVTNKRVIGKSIFKLGFNRFEGKILYDQIINVIYKERVPILRTSSINIEYQEERGKTSQAVIRFQDTSAFRAAYDSEKIYHLIVSQVQETKRSQ